MILNILIHVLYLSNTHIALYTYILIVVGYMLQK